MTTSASREQYNPFVDLTKIIESFKLPGIDARIFAETSRKDFDAVLAANRTAMDLMQELSRRQTEIFTQATRTVQDGIQNLTKGGAALPDPLKQTELVREVFAKAIADMSELAKMIGQAQKEAMAAITRRAQQSIDDLKKLVRPK